MSDTPNIPPKVAPGANKPRPITIRLKKTGAPSIPGVTLKKPGETPPSPVPAAPLEPVTSPVAETPPPAPAAEPIAPAAASVPVTPAPTAVKASQTSRIPLSEILPDTTMSGETIESNPTIKMKSVTSSTQNIPVEELKEPSAEQQQAAKSKTARIALDSVLSGIETKAPTSSPQKTIRLKRPGGIGAGPAAPAAGGEATGVEEKKTIKMKRPGTITLKRSGGGSDEPEMTPIENLDDIPMAPLDDLLGAPAAEENKAFSVVALVACIATMVLSLSLILCLGSQALGKNPAPSANTLYSIEASPLPWPGK